MHASANAQSQARCHISSREIQRVLQAQREARLARRTSKTQNDRASALSAKNVPPPPVSPDFGTFSALDAAGELLQVPPSQQVTKIAEPENGEKMCHDEPTAGASATRASKPSSGRPTNSKSRAPLTQDEKDQVSVLIAYGHSLRQAAAKIGRSHMTISRHLKKDLAFAEQVQRYQTYAESNAMMEVVKASRRTWRAAAWLLQYLERRERNVDRGAA